MRKICLLLLLFISRQLLAQPVAFIQTGNLENALTRAKTSGKLVFIDVYTDWCAPCRMMDREYFTDPEIAGRMNAFFVNLKANAERNGKGLAQQFGVVAYPTIIVLSSDGSMLQKFTGAPQDKAAFLAIISALLPNSAEGQVFAAYASAWENGGHMIELADYYFRLRTKYGMDNAPLLHEYLFELPPDSLQRPSVEKLIIHHNSSTEGLGFAYLLEHRDDPRCAFALQRSIDMQYKKAVSWKNERYLELALDAIATLAASPETAAYQQARLRMAYYLDTGHPERFHEAAAQFVPNQLIPLLRTEQDSARFQEYANALSNIAWQYATYVKKKKHLAHALAWLNQCPEAALTEECRQYRATIAANAK